MEDNTKAALQQILLGVRHNRAPCSRWVLEPAFPWPFRAKMWECPKIYTGGYTNP